MANGVQLAGHVNCDYAIIGGMAGAHQFAHIGAHTYIAGHTVISKDVPPFIKAGREPLSFVGVNSWACKEEDLQTKPLMKYQIFTIHFL